jgi:mycothiol synthase
MRSSPPDGFTARPATEEDLGAAAAIVRAEEEALRGASVWDVGDMSDFWRMANFDGAAWVIERDRVPVAFGVGIERGLRSDWWITVHPRVSGRGLSTWLLDQAEARARAAGTPAVNVGTFAENAAACRLFEARGYRPARHYFQMRAVLDGEPDPPEWPAGLEFDRFRLDDAHAFHAAVEEAFAHEWGHTTMPFEEWKQFRLEAPDTDLSLWFVARDGAELAGFARCEANRHGGGWIGLLGVRERWRRRGIGLALLCEALREFHRRGAPHVGLGVDAQNPTGATRLYERAGFRVVKEDIVYEKELG